MTSPRRRQHSHLELSDSGDQEQEDKEDSNVRQPPPELKQCVVALRPRIRQQRVESPVEGEEEKEAEEEGEMEPSTGEATDSLLTGTIYKKIQYDNYIPYT